ncbi:MAG: zinc-dependent alcohol dehydrogenase [Desulfovibrionales bacterium]
MKALVFHDIGDIRLQDVPEPKIENSTDAVVRLTSTAICGTDLHMVRGTMPGMVKGTILGHEGVGVVEETGPSVRNLIPGDRVVIPSTIGCGSCSYCRAGYFSQCDVANPNGPRAGTAFFGGPKSTGPFQGLQAEFARIPFANVGPVKLPDSMTDDQAILLSDIFPTGYFGADMAEIKPGDTVAVFGCGPVGLFAVLSCFLLDAGRVIAVDRHPVRLEKAKELGAETINFDVDDPVGTVLSLTGGIGVDRVIDAVGVDAEPPKSGPAAKRAAERRERFEKEVAAVAPRARPKGDLWKPGQGPSQALDWALECIAKAGTLSVIGVYPQSVEFFPWGKAMMMNLTLKAGNCPHRRYLRKLVHLVESGAVRPEQIISQVKSLDAIVEAYKSFDTREPGWVKVELETA